MTSIDDPSAVLLVNDSREKQELVRKAIDAPGLTLIGTEGPDKGLTDFLRLRPRIVLIWLQTVTAAADLLRRILAVDPGIEAILIAKQYSPEAAIEAIQKGACDYLAEPLDVDRLGARVRGLLADAKLRQKTVQLDHELLDACQFEGIVGRSPLMFEVFVKLRRIAPHFSTALITGESGTGKELIAHALHRLSPADQSKFVICNCSALVDTLMESELFGHVRGAFTGANTDKIGLFEHANGGTIFLDEIGELSLAAQAKLLRVLQNRQIQRVGALSPRNLKVRVIAATHRNLQAMVRDRQFREDLYYRLSAIEIRVPSLTDRREDIPLLVRHFIHKFSSEYRKSIAGFSRGAQLRISSYPWPGNVRELENVIGNACMMSDDEVMNIDDLPEKFRQPFNAGAIDESLVSLEEAQKRHVLRVLEKVNGNKARAAEVLGIGRATIYSFLSRIKPPRRGQNESA